MVAAVGVGDHEAVAIDGFALPRAEPLGRLVLDAEAEAEVLVAAVLGKARDRLFEALDEERGVPLHEVRHALVASDLDLALRAVAAGTAPFEDDAAFAEGLEGVSVAAHEFGSVHQFGFAPCINYIRLPTV